MVNGVPREVPRPKPEGPHFTLYTLHCIIMIIEMFMHFEKKEQSIYNLLREETFSLGFTFLAFTVQEWDCFRDSGG